jgi:hypothetical protein
MNTLFLEKRMISLIDFLKKIFMVIGYIAQIYAHIFNKLSAKNKAIQLTGLFSFISIVILTQAASTLGLFTFVIGAALATVILFVILAIKNM